MKRCAICGEVVEDDVMVCPVCKATKFVPIDESAEIKFACVHEVGVAKGLDEEVVKGLRANFEGECTEVGMYLAMARVAEREGYPEIAEAYKRRSTHPNSQNFWASASRIRPKRIWNFASRRKRAPAKAN